MYAAERLRRLEQQITEELKKIPNLIGNAYEMARQKGLKEMACPKCGSEMEIREYGYCSQIIIDLCPKCSGIWLNKGEIQALEVFCERARIETDSMRKGFLKNLIELFQ